MVTKHQSEPTPIEPPKATPDPVHTALVAGKPKSEKNDKDQRVARLADMPDIYSSTNSAVHPATGVVSSQVQTALDEIEEQSGQVLRKHILSETGRRVADDIRLAAQAGNRVLTELDDGELFQKIVDVIKRIQSKAEEEVADKADHAADIGGKVATQLQESSKAIVHLGKLVVTSSEFRKILGDSIDFLSDLIVTWTGKAEDAVEDASSSDAAAMAKDGKSKAKGVLDQVKDKTQEASSKAQKALGSGQISDHNAGGLVKDTSFEDVDVKGDDIAEARDAAKEHAADLLESARDKAEHVAEIAVDKLKDGLERIKISAEDRHKLLAQFKKIVLDIQAHPDYSPAIQHLEKAFLRIKKVTTPIAQDLAGTAQSDPDVIELENLIQEALSKLAGGRSIDKAKNEILTFLDLIKEDKEIEQYFEDLSEFFRKSIEETEFVQSVDYEDKFEEFVTRGSDILDANEEYRTCLRAAAKETKKIGDKVANDPGLKLLSASTESLIRDAFLDDSGRPTVKPELLSDLRKVLPTVIKENLANVSLPRMEHNDKDYSFALDNLVLHGDAIVPRFIVVDSRVTLDTSEVEESKGITSFIRIQLSEMYVSADDVFFSYKKHSGIHMSDSGLLDFNTPRKSKGINIELTLSPDLTESSKSFKMVESKCEIDDLDIKIHDAQKHNLLYKVFRPMIETIVRKKIEDAVATRLFETIFSADAKIQSFRNAL